MDVVSLGMTYAVSPSLFIGGELGYQRAFTSTQLALGDETLEADFQLLYMHIGLGAGSHF